MYGGARCVAARRACRSEAVLDSVGGSSVGRGSESPIPGRSKTRMRTEAERARMTAGHLVVVPAVPGMRMRSGCEREVRGRP